MKIKWLTREHWCFHRHTIRERRDGVLVLVCDRCDTVIPTLQTEVRTDGPQQKPAKVEGQPQYVVKVLPAFPRRAVR